MPVRLTWDEPNQPVVGYRIFRIEGTATLVIPTHLLDIVPALPRQYDDVTYDRETIQTQGYTYGITALGESGESILSNIQFVQVDFDQNIYDETWDFTLGGTEVPQYVEEWEFILGLSPSLFYTETWDAPTLVAEPWDLPVDISTMLEVSEPWELPTPPVFSLEVAEEWES